MRQTSFDATRVSIFALATSLGVTFAAPSAMAQQEEPRSFGIEEIVITAQKRAESLQDVPIAVTAISGGELEELDVASLQDIGNRTPGMVFAAFSVGQPEIAIRGIGTKEDGASASDSTVVSIDGVYIAARTAQVFDIFDLERVEILRGPQGTLYGKNAIGGSINFVTTTPTEETRVRLRQTVGNYDRFDTAGLISGEIAENLYGKFSFSRRKHDGFLRNILPSWTDPVTGQEIDNPEFGKRQGEMNTFAWRAALRWLPSERLEVILGADGADDSMGASNREPVGGAGPLHDCGCASDPIAVNEALGGAGDPWTTLAETEGFTERDVYGISLTVNYDLDWATFTSISAYRESDFDWLEDSEGLPPGANFADLTGASGNPGIPLTAPASTGFAFDVSDAAVEKAEQWVQEFRLTSPDGERLKWVAGLFYSNEDIDRTETFFFPTLGGPGVEPSLSASIQSNKTDAVAAYGQATYDLTETVSATAGLRYSYEKKKMSAAADIVSGLPLLLQGFAPVSADESWNNVSWRASIDWRATDDILAYASVSTGFKSGGFTGSASTAARATTPFDPEKATNFEVGIKSDLFDRRARLNVTGFFTDYKDLQVTRFFQPVGSGFGEFITENAGKAEIYGLEVEFLARPVEGLDIGGSYAYLDAEFKEFTGTPSVTDPNATFDGNKLRQAPKHMFNAYTRYQWSLGNEGDIYARVDYRYQSKSFYDPDENPLATIPAYDIWDARVGYISPDQRWEVAAWIKNIGEEKYRTHVFTQRGGRIAFATHGDPRTYGLTLTYNY